MWDEKFDELANALPVGILFVDEGDRLLGANGLGLSYNGLDESAIGRKAFSSLLRDQGLKDAVTGKLDEIIQLDLHTSGRSYRAEVRPMSGEEAGTKLITLRDVTGIPHAHILRRNFIFDLFHKIRTPLTTILSVLSMASSGHLDPSRFDLPEVLAMGAKEAERLTSLMGRLRDLFLIEAGSLGLELEIQPLVVGEVVQAVAARFNARVAAKSQTLEQTFPDEEITALADPQFLPRVLQMVIQNAHVYTPEGGKIELTVEASSGHVSILVTDDGPGIAEEDLPGVFERFRRGSTPLTHSVEGEGLGLYLARHLLLAQNGTLHLDSTEGVGTRVEIHLPRSEVTE